MKHLDLTGMESIYLEVVIDGRISSIKDFINRFQCESKMELVIKSDKEELAVLESIRNKLVNGGKQ